jgi:predicted acylesterase/phospholipase RssA
MGADVVIAVDINVDPEDPDLWDKKFGSSLMPKLLPPFTLNAYRSFWIMIQALTQTNYQRAQPEIIIKPQFSNGTAVFFGFRHAEQVISDGEKAARAALPDINAALHLHDAVA